MCEPKLDKRGLYPTLGKKLGDKKMGENILKIWGLADGNCDIIDIADKINLPAFELKQALDEAIKHKLIKELI